MPTKSVQRQQQKATAEIGNKTERGEWRERERDKANK